MNRLNNFEEERRKEKMKTEEINMNLALGNLGMLMDVKEDMNFEPELMCCLCQKG